MDDGFSTVAPDPVRDPQPAAPDPNVEAIA
jgi:hypothetical protein